MSAARNKPVGVVIGPGSDGGVTASYFFGELAPKETK
jgi:hypothetical protein